MEDKSNPRKSNFKIKKILFIVFFEMIFTITTIIPYALFGPYKNVRNAYVTTAMATGSHTYLARIFFTDSQIKKILAEENKADNADVSVIKNNNDKVTITYNDNGIERQNISTTKFDGIVLIINDPKRVKVGYAKKIGVEGETTHDIAERYGAVAAINGGGFLDVLPDGKLGGIGAVPDGIIMTGGELIYPKAVNSNTVINSIMAIDSEGHLIVGGPYSISDLKNKNVKEAVCFTPYLIRDGKAFIPENTLQGSHPRTAIGQDSKGRIILLVVDGRQGMKIGATLKEVQKIMLDFGAVNAMCLDGGGSTTMYYNGSIINNPCSFTGERTVPSIIYVSP